jgi:fatty acid desaturase
VAVAAPRAPVTSHFRILRHRVRFPVSRPCLRDAHVQLRSRTLGHSCCPPMARGLRFDWRGAPGADTLPSAVSGRGAIIAVVLALWIAITVAWGWAAGMTLGFAVAIVLVRMAGVILGGTLIQQAGRSYYERQLRGRRRVP